MNIENHSKKSELSASDGVLQATTCKIEITPEIRAITLKRIEELEAEAERLWLEVNSAEIALDPFKKRYEAAIDAWAKPYNAARTLKIMLS